MEAILTGVLALALNNIGAIIGVCILFAFVGILTQIKKDLIKKLVDTIKEGRHHYDDDPTVQMSITCDKDINMELTRLLFGTKSSRAGLFLFHDGNVFSTNGIIWKISETHERCESGITQEFDKIQDIKASLLTPLISPMFTGVDVDGVISVKPVRCPTTDTVCARKPPIYKVYPDGIQNSFVQTFLNNRGTKFAILTPLMDWHNAVVGFVLLEYCHDGFLTDEELDSNLHLACKTTSKIYQLISGIDPSNIVTTRQIQKNIK